ncbi:YbjQ family protein [Dokdonia sinensis]|uniref:YbjQ family protein n=1 Tax=Dokdonia sinensis TaxID=2479847 RepID=A0A3M0GK05_9FLAO|nr:heavy metal-binding domain-containing protein [Dokdonia sinensis]RMB57646.1 YbjQ family protein [Dokdonia sinensis]
MILSTTDTIQGKEIHTYLGLVSATIYTSSFKTKGLSFKDQFNSEKTYENYEKGLEAAKEEAFIRLRENAKAMQANAIVGISMDVETMGQVNLTTISVMGTAVALK